MVNLLPSSLSDGPLVHLPESARSKSILAVNPPQPSQMLLKWDESVLAETAPSQLTPAQLAAMHRLVKRIAQLRSTTEIAADSPEALLPYVSPEAHEALMQLSQTGSASIQSAQGAAQVGTVSHDAARPQPQKIQHLKTLIPHLLWSIAKSTHEAVRLIEGVRAEVGQENQTGQTGVLRLVVMLNLKTERHTHGIDLVTSQPAPALLKDCQIQIQNSLLAQQPIPETVLLQQLVAQVTATEPILERFLQGFAADWLISTRDWQSGTLSLQLGFEFTAISPTPTLPSSPQPFAEQSSPILRFTHPAWLEQHITSAVEHQLTQVLHNYSLLNRSHSPVTVVQQGCAAIDGLQRSLTLASRTFAQQPLSLQDLGLRLLWGINRTAYEVMQLTSGIRVSLWQPDQAQSSGLLRFVVQLDIRTPEHTQSFDLVRRALGSVTSPLATTAIIQSGDCEWCRQPVLVSHLETMLRQEIDQNAPELVLLQSDTEVSIQNEDIWQTGVLQLNTAFEFIPDVGFAAS